MSSVFIPLSPDGQREPCEMLPILRAAVRASLRVTTKEAQA